MDFLLLYNTSISRRVGWSHLLCLLCFVFGYCFLDLLFKVENIINRINFYAFLFFSRKNTYVFLGNYILDYAS